MEFSSADQVILRLPWQDVSSATVRHRPFKPVEFVFEVARKLPCPSLGGDARFVVANVAPEHAIALECAFENRGLKDLLLNSEIPSVLLRRPLAARYSPRLRFAVVAATHVLSLFLIVCFLQEAAARALPAAVARHLAAVIDAGSENIGSIADALWSRVVVLSHSHPWAFNAAAVVVGGLTWPVLSGVYMLAAGAALLRRQALALVLLVTMVERIYTYYYYFRKYQSALMKMYKSLVTFRILFRAPRAATTPTATTPTATTPTATTPTATSKKED